MTVYFVTGASRGIGLETVRQLSALPDAYVVAAARNPDGSAELQEIIKKSDGNVASVVLDIASPDSVKAAVKATLEIPFIKSNSSSIDYFFQVAGVSTGGPTPASGDALENLQADAMINFVGVALITVALLPLLKTSLVNGPARILNVSTLLASSSWFTKIGDFAKMAPSYSASKAAGTMWMRKLAEELKTPSPALEREGGWLITQIHPGLVETDMARGMGGISVQESVEGILKVALSVKEEDHNKFYDNTGAELDY